MEKQLQLTVSEGGKPRERRTCTRCNGTTRQEFGGYIRADGTRAPAVSYTCSCCGGRGHFEAPDVATILASIAGRKGLRSNRPRDGRSYYVWRMARFHGGADVTMPMCAMGEVSGDPFIEELDALAELVAKRAFGTHLAGAHRWGNLLVGTMPRVVGLPATAYESGPVLNGVTKPESEIAEMA